MAPVFGSRTIPAKYRIFLAIAISACVYPTLLDPQGMAAPNLLPTITNGLFLWTMGVAVAMELLVGILIGYGASLPLIGMQLGGRIIDQQMGLGIAGVFNPELGEQTGVVSEFFFVMSIAIFLIIGGHRVLFATLVGSFNHIPLGGFVSGGHMVDLIIGLLGSMFELGLRVAAPLLCLFFLQTVAMGFIARTVPQMNILSIGFALRIMAGALIVIGALGVIGHVFEQELIISLRRLGVFFAP